MNNLLYVHNILKKKGKYMQIKNGYKSILSPHDTEKAIKSAKDIFEKELSGSLKLSRLTSPLFVEENSGINDDLSGVEKPVSFSVSALGGKRMEIVQSLAKWKRMALADYSFPLGRGIYTDMNALRPDDKVDEIHSVYVDQWDWEKAIRKEERNLDYLKKTVREIFFAIKRTAFLLEEFYPQIKDNLAEDITFIHSEDLLEMYPNLLPEEREKRAAKEYGAVFIIGIGSTLKDGRPHSLRAPDYDDWSTETDGMHKGLNGDIIVWDTVREDSLELSSMGIRVDRTALLRQLKLSGNEERASLYWHKRLLSGDYPETIGGGIGQSRLCMFLLKKCHIGEVQASVWPEEVRREAEEKSVYLI